MKYRGLWRTKAPIDSTSPGQYARERRGFALPMAILIIAFLTVTIAAAYSATSSEITTNMAQRGESRAYMIAQAGLENFIARRNEGSFCPACAAIAPPASVLETTTVVVPGGRAFVAAERIRTGNNSRSAIYLLRSTGIDDASITISGSALRSSMNAYGTSADSTKASRTVAQLVYWNVNQVNVLSGWTSTSGLDKQGSSGTISGVDACGKKPSVAGIAIPDGDYDVNGQFTPQGNPPVKYLGDQAATNAAVKIDWEGVVTSNRIQADYTYATEAAAAAAWGTAIDFGNGSNLKYPVIRVNDNFTLPGTGGQGTLIVMGDLTMSGNNLWKGILLVGGKMTSNGNGTVSGATMSGLNTLLKTPTSTPPGNSLAAARAIFAGGNALTNTPGDATANGTKTFQYDSCEVAKAANGLASYSVFPNAWMDNFVTY
jgi:hypothetical protein